MSTSKQHPCVRGPLQECRSIRSGASGLPCYCTPLVCISAVIGLLAVWRHNKPKIKNQRCTHNLAHILILCFLLHFHFCDSYVRVRQFVYTLPSSSIFIHIHSHMYTYTCFDYSVMIHYKLYTPIMINLCLPAATCWSRTHVCMSTPCAAIKLEYLEYTMKYIYIKKINQSNKYNLQTLNT